MRMGLRGWKRQPPHQAAGYVLIAVGIIVMLLSLPLYVYMSILGGMIAYVGYSMMRGR
jgi:hypothetical protein